MLKCRNDQNSRLHARICRGKYNKTFGNKV